MHRHRWLLPVALAILTAATTTLAVRSTAETHPEAFGRSGPITPVLSARRVPAYLAAPIGDVRLRRSLDEVIAASSEATCLVVDSPSGEVFAHQGGRPLVPASTQKLLTAAVALDVLGEDSRYRTEVRGAVAPGGIVEGDLHLVGGGDPVLVTEDFLRSFRRPPDEVTRFEDLADAIVEAGVTEVRGSVVGDEERYDRVRYVPNWPPRFAAQNQTGPLGSLMVNRGFAVFTAEFDNFLVAPSEDPSAHAAEVLTRLLRARGVDVAGDPRSGPATGAASTVAAIESPPLGDIVVHAVRDSNNTASELIVKEIGHAAAGLGSTAAGAEAMAGHVADAGLPGAGVAVADGSGLASDNRLTCSLLMGILRTESPASTIGRGLAVAGVSGTLANRYRGTPLEGRLRAKTGTLNQVTALAGYVESTQGRTLTFAYIVNLEPPARVGGTLIGVQQALAGAMLRYPEGPPLAALGPLARDADQPQQPGG